MTLLKIPRFTCVGLLIAACAAPAPEATVDIAAEQDAIRAISSEWLQHARDRDAAAIAAFIMDDGVRVLENRDPIVGVDAIREQIAADFAANPNQTPDFGSERIEISESGDMAVEYGRYDDTNLGADGTGQDSGRYMTLYKKVNGEWRVMIDFVVSTTPEGS